MTVKYLDSKRISALSSDFPTTTTTYDHIGDTNNAGLHAINTAGGHDGTKVGIKIIAGSPAIGTKIEYVSMSIRKWGSSTGNYVFQVIDGTDGTTVLASATSSVSALTETPATVELQLDSVVTLSVNDRIVLSYPDGSGSNIIGLARNSATTESGYNRTILGYSTTTWSDTAVNNMIMTFDSSPVSISKPTNVQDNSILVEKDTGNRYWFSEALAPTYETETFTPDWDQNTTGTTNIEVANSRVEYDVTDSGTSQSTLVYDLGTANISETAWVLRGKCVIDNYNSGSGSSCHFFCGLSNGDKTVAFDGSQNSISFAIGVGTSDTAYYLGSSVNGAMYSMTSQTSGNITHTPTAETVYFEIIRNNATSATITLYTDSTYTTTPAGYSRTLTLSSAPTGLRYLVFKSRDRSISGNSLDGHVDDLEFYNGVTSVTPATWTMEPTFEDDTFSSGWTKTGTLVTANTSTNVLDWDSASSSNQATTYDIGYALSTKFIFRSKLIIDTITNTTSDSQQIYIGLFDASHGTSTSTAQDGFALYIISDTAGGNNKQYRIRVEGDGSTGFSNTAGDGGNYTKKPTAETIYVELVRNEDVFTINLYSDSGYSTLIETKSFTETNVTGLQYVGIKNYLSSANGALNGTLDDLKIYNGVTTIN